MQLEIAMENALEKIIGKRNCSGIIALTGVVLRCLLLQLLDESIKHLNVAMSILQTFEVPNIFT